MNLHCWMLAVLAVLASGEFAFAQEPTAKQRALAAGQTAFLQENFTNFGPVAFLPCTNKTETVIQRFWVNEHVIGTYAGLTYTGVRFTLPEWLDGDLQWNFFHLNPESQKRQRVDLSWGVVDARGEGWPKQTIRRIDPDDSLEF